MSDEDVKRIKIEVEEEAAGKSGGDASQDIVEELRDLGRQVADAIRTAWESEERRHFETEVREGIHSFVTEVDKAFKDVRESDAAQRVKQEADGVKSRIDSSDVGQTVMDGVSEGLRWLSETIGAFADQFTPPAKGPESTVEEEEAA